MTSYGLVSTDLPKNRDSHFWQALITTNPTSKATYKLFLTMEYQCYVWLQATETNGLNITITPED